MSLHSYSICWLHLVFNTLDKKPILHKELRIILSNYFKEYSKEKNIYHRINYVNPEHVHILIDLPTTMSVDQAVMLYKGSSSCWINKKNYLKGKFCWGRGYGAFNISPSKVCKVSEYIAGQEAHHKVKTFQEEYDQLMAEYKKKYSY
jgi:putative transposase